MGGNDVVPPLVHPVKVDPEAAITQASEDALQLMDPYVAALSNFYAGNFDRAITELQEALLLEQRDSDYIKDRLVQAYIGRASGYINEGTCEAYGRAVDDLDHVMMYRQNNAVAYNDRAIAYAGEGNRAQALNDYTNAINLDPGFELALVNRGLIFLQKGDCQRAITDSKRAYGQNSSSPEAQNALSWALATCPDPAYRDGKMAVMLATKACDSTRRSNSAFLDTLAAAYAEAGDFDNAVHAEQSAIGVEEREPNPRSNVVATFGDRVKLYGTRQAYRAIPNQASLSNRPCPQPSQRGGT
jgi:Flp pilus assembly protein TadD